MSAIRTVNLHCSFGSLVVTKDVSLDVAQGERRVIIGPNGAGKTTLINQISGQLAPDSGRILLGDVDVTGWSPAALCRAGIARTFQRNNLFRNMTILENVCLAVQARRGSQLNFFNPMLRNLALVERAREVLRMVKLEADQLRIVRQISYGEQRQLEIALALAGDPTLLLLDEPTSGMSSTETGRMIDLIASLPRQITIVMIEHDMKVVFSLADRITVLFYGECLATGSSEEIQKDARVREVYLGKGH